MDKRLDEISHPEGWRVSLSIVVSLGWLIFLIVWLAFFAGNGTYSLYQNIAIVLASILVLIMILGGSWALWGMRHIPEEGKEMMRKKGFKSRIIVSIVVPFVLMIFLIIWFFFYADGLNNGYENLAIFLVVILVAGGVLGVMWAPWGMKHQKEFEKWEKEEDKKE